LEVFLQRLQQEHAADVISTAPTVPYEIELAGDPQQQQQQGEKQRLVLESVAEYPRNQKVGSLMLRAFAASRTLCVSCVGFDLHPATAQPTAA
jgi:translation elongation factor EF-4